MRPLPTGPRARHPSPGPGLEPMTCRNCGVSFTPAHVERCAQQVAHGPRSPGRNIALLAFPCTWPSMAPGVVGPRRRYFAAEQPHDRGRGVGLLPAEGEPAVASVTALDGCHGRDGLTSPVIGSGRADRRRRHPLQHRHLPEGARRTMCSVDCSRAALRVRSSCWRPRVSPPVVTGDVGPLWVLSQPSSPTTADEGWGCSRPIVALLPPPYVSSVAV